MDPSPVRGRLEFEVETTNGGERSAPVLIELYP